MIHSFPLILLYVIPLSNIFQWSLHVSPSKAPCHSYYRGKGTASSATYLFQVHDHIRPYSLSAYYTSLIFFYFFYAKSWHQSNTKTKSALVDNTTNPFIFNQSCIKKEGDTICCPPAIKPLLNPIHMSRSLLKHNTTCLFSKEATTIQSLIQNLGNQHKYY